MVEAKREYLILFDEFSSEEFWIKMAKETVNEKE